MKIHKMFCIDIGLAKKLDGQNASSLVNNLLIEYFEKNDDPYKNWTREELELENKKFSILKEANEKIRGIENGTTI